MDRIPASERTRERLKALMEGHGEAGDLRSELVRLAARLIVEEGLEGEATDAVGREYYVRGAAPGTGYRNGYRMGQLKTAEGMVEYAAPQISDRAVPFRSRLREIIRGRSEELEALAVEMYARGLSTRDIEALFADEDGRSLLSRTAVSEITERLWAEYEAFASRDLSVSEDQWPEFKARTIACYQAASPMLARLLRDDIVATYGAALPSALACLQDDFEACIAHLRFPLAHRRAIRTTNLLERLFGEERRRTKVIPHAFGERAVLKLMYAALIRAAERWRGLRMTEFERRQLTAIRNELDRAHAERTAPVVSANVTATSTRLSSKSRT